MRIRRVEGLSMKPALMPGDLVILRRGRPRAGSMVMASVNGREVIKRISKHIGDEFWLHGDNPGLSTDSRHYGSISKKAILGVVKRKFSFAHGSAAPVPRNKRLLAAPFLLAGITVIFLLAEAFLFDKFVIWLEDYQMAGEVGAKALAAAIIVLQLFSLPFWLRMRLSLLARICSSLCGIVLTMLWPFSTLFLFSQLTEKLSAGTNLDDSFSVQLLINMLLSFLTVWSFYILGGIHLVRRLKPVKV